ncbi:MAG: catalase family protein [Planctomycetota bacterium]|nr:catalase family protein [Planctomycetota bacterium]
MPTLATDYVRYSDSVETKQPDEEKTIAEISAVMGRLSALMNDRYRHAVRSVHSKSHGLLKAELKVSDGLPEKLRQGLFGVARTYPAIVRFSTVPGDILADSVSTPRGMAVKVVGVEGMEMLPGHAGEVTQDFVFVNAKSFGAPDVKAFLKLQHIIEQNANDPEIFKKLVSNVARGTNAVLGLVGAESGTLAQLGHPETHILGETYGSTAALRYGDYIAKIIFKPISENLKALAKKHVGVNFHFSGLRDAVVEFFKTETAVWEVGVQLCADLKTMPVEDPSVAWPEEVSRMRTAPSGGYMWMKYCRSIRGMGWLRIGRWGTSCGRG